MGWPSVRGGTREGVTELEPAGCVLALAVAGVGVVASNGRANPSLSGGGGPPERVRGGRETRCCLGGGMHCASGLGSETETTANIRSKALMGSFTCLLAVVRELSLHTDGFSGTLGGCDFQ